MKKTLITFLVMLFSVFAGQTYAHDPHHENDSVKMSATERKADSVMQLEMAEHQQMEAVNDLIFYLLDGDAKPLDMKDVNGSVKMQYADKSKNTIDLMMIDGKLTAMKMRNGKSFTAICTLNKGSKSYSASFNSAKDLPSNK